MEGDGMGITGDYVCEKTSLCIMNILVFVPVVLGFATPRYLLCCPFLVLFVLVLVCFAAGKRGHENIISRGILPVLIVM